jgi:hypothetical protein
MKSETDLSKLARWAIPGWVAILAVFLFLVVDMLACEPGQTRSFQNVGELISTLSDVDVVFTTVLIAATGIPLGFTIYQAYFYLRWNSPFSRDGLFSPLLPGRMSDLQRVTSGIGHEDLTRSAEWRESWVAHPLYKRDHGYRWRYIELLFSEAAQILDTRFGGGSVYARHRYLHEVMHTLGASIGALYLGFLVYVLVIVLRQGVSLAEYLFFAFLSLSIFLVLLHLEDRAQQLVEAERSQEQVDGTHPIAAFTIGKGTPFIGIVSPAAMFVALVTLIHFFGNPAISRAGGYLDEWIRIAMVVLAIVIWAESKDKPPAFIRRGDYAGLILVGSVGYGVSVLPSELTSWIDWSYFSALLMFLIGNLILLQNRRNVKEDMIALERYTLYRYFTEILSEPEAEKAK